MKTRLLTTRFSSAALVLLCALALAWLPSRASAQFSFTVNPAPVTGAPGDTVTFFGTLTNTGTSALASDLNPGFNLFSGPAGADLTAFPVYLGDVLAPDTLAPSTTVTGPLFSVALDPAAPLGQYGFNFSFSYGGSPVGQDLFVNVASPQAVPEAGTGLGLAFGLLCLFAIWKRRTQATPVDAIG